MRETLGSYGLRLSGRASYGIGLAWLVVVLALSIPSLRAHLEYASEGHPRLFPYFVGALLLAAFLAPPAYQLIRRRGWWRHEPVALAAFGLAALLMYEPLGTLLTLWILVVCFGAGAFVLDRLKLQPEAPLERLCLATAAGLSILVWPLTLMGHFGLFVPWAFLTLLAVPTVLFAGRIRQLPTLLGDLRGRWTGAEELRSPLVSLAIVFASVLLVCGLMVALAPSIAFDPLKFHLPLARHYSETGGLHPIATDNYGYNPQNYEMLLTIGYRLAGQVAAQPVSPFFAVFFLLALLAIGRRAGVSRGSAVVGGVFAMGVPYLHMTGMNSKHDLIVGFLQFSALLCYFHWRDTGKFRWIHLGVYLAATSLGFKHPAAFGVIGLALLFIPAAWRQPRRARAIVSCALIVLVFGLFWQTRSYVLTGDPFIYYNVRQPLPPEHEVQVGSLSKRIHTLLTWPYTTHFDGEMFFRSATISPMGILLALFAPLWLLLRRRCRSPEAAAALTYAIGALIPWSFYVPLLRFVAGPIAILVFFTVDRLCSVTNDLSPRVVRFPLRLATNYAVAFGLCVTWILEINVPQFRYFSKQTDKPGYLREALLTYRSLEELRPIATANDTVYALHNCSMLYAPHPDRFYCDYSDLTNPEHLERLERVLPDVNAQFLITPKNPPPAALERITGASAPARRFSGPHYDIYGLAPTDQ